MGIQARWKQLVGRKEAPRRPPEIDPGAVENALDHAFRRVRDVDPETLLQWRSLEAIVSRGRSVEKARGVIPAGRLIRVAAACAAAAAVVIIVLAVWPHGREPATYQTGKGQVSTVMLPDSSEVTLNHTSELVVDGQSFETLRHVILKGEALFRVHRLGTPFLVTTDVGAVRVVGTEFDVRVRGGRMAVGVLAGKVSMTVTRSGRDSTVALQAGQLATCSAAGFPGQPIPLQLSGYPGWVHGRLIFYHASVSDICAEIESRFDVVIRIENPDLRKVSITGTLEAGSAAAAISTLAKLAGRGFRHENSVYILY